MNARVARIPVMHRDDETVQQVAARLAEQGLQISGRLSRAGRINAIPLSLPEKVADAKAMMGPKLVCHPDYRFSPRHSHNPEVADAARAEYLRGVRALAQADREQNPAYVRSQAIVGAVSK